MALLEDLTPFLEMRHEGTILHAARIMRTWALNWGLPVPPMPHEEQR